LLVAEVVMKKLFARNKELEERHEDVMNDRKSLPD